METKTRRCPYGKVKHSGKCPSLILDKLITSTRKRKGCDICKEDKPTEKFGGANGDVCWICEDCLIKFGIIKD